MKDNFRILLDNLFDKIKHGDAEHQNWLKSAIDDFYHENKLIDSFDYIEDWRNTFNLPNRTQPQTTTEKEAKLALDLIKEELNELDDAIFEKVSYAEPFGDRILTDTNYKPNLPQIADACADLFFVVTQMCRVHGLKPRDLIKRVYDSNMSKLADNLDEAVVSVKKYEDSGLPAHWDLLDNGKFIIKRTQDNKVLKSVKFKEPDWSDLNQ